jgi:hypothetical protein
MTTYTADYTLGVNNKWSARLRPSDTPDTTIDTNEHDDFADCAAEAFDLAGPDAEVVLGDVRGDG